MNCWQIFYIFDLLPLPTFTIQKHIEQNSSLLLYISYETYFIIRNRKRQNGMYFHFSPRMDFLGTLCFSKWSFGL